MIIKFKNPLIMSTPSIFYFIRGLLITLFYEIILLRTKLNILDTEVYEFNNDFYLAKENY